MSFVKMTNLKKGPKIQIASIWAQAKLHFDVLMSLNAVNLLHLQSGENHVGLTNFFPFQKQYDLNI